MPDASALLTHVDKLAAAVLTEAEDSTSCDRWSSSLLQLAVIACDCGRKDVAAMAEAAVSTLSAGTAGDTLIAVITDIQAALSSVQPISSATSIAQDPELMCDFVVECREHLQTIESQLLALERNSAGSDALNSLFRSFHTIKGLAGFLELPLIQEVAHQVETVLDRYRQGGLRVSGSTVDIILEARDYIATWLNVLALDPLADAASTPQRPDSLLNGVAMLAEATAAETGPGAESGLDRVEAAAWQNGSGATRVVKVDTAKLDYLVDMVGELVIAQSLVRHHPDLSDVKNQALSRHLAQLARITDEVQRTAMAMRMVPVGPLFKRMARLVRDLSRKSGKPVELVCEGENVELDRNIVEELADPLMHMVRNAMDHGLETAAQRGAAGKPVTGQLALRAAHRSGQVVIEVADDGRGISRERVLAKARQQGLVSAGSTPGDAEILNLIFHPGFSTAEKVSDISGRGVGMDVVRKQIQKLRGSIDIRSEEGTGTSFALRLPLTLAIIDGLIIGVGRERYVIPLGAVREMLRPSPGMVSRIENRAEVVILRDRMLPVVRLYERFGKVPRSTDPAESVLVVADTDSASFCLMVDELIGKQEVVIKSLGPLFDRSPGIAGGAILGDGHIGLILDLNGIFGGGADA